MSSIHAIDAGPVVCPSCPRPAEIIDRFTFASTDGPVEHVKVRCPGGHWYTVPASRVRAFSADLEDLAA
jgi:hypothetical protein